MLAPERRSESREVIGANAGRGDQTNLETNAGAPPRAGTDVARCEWVSTMLKESDYKFLAKLSLAELKAYGRAKARMEMYGDGHDQRPAAPAGQVQVTAEAIVRCYKKALGEIPEAPEQPRGDDAASVGARAILAAYNKAMGKGD